MKKVTVFLSILLIFVMMAINVPAHAEDKKSDKDPASDTKTEKQFVVDVNNAKCPVMGGDAVKDLVQVYEGKLFHYCCPACKPNFKKDPAKYMAKLKPAAEKDQIKIEVAGNEKCPVTGEEVNKDVYAVKEGKLYYFCCKDCIKKFLSPDFDGKLQKCEDEKTEKK